MDAFSLIRKLICSAASPSYAVLVDAGIGDIHEVPLEEIVVKPYRFIGTEPAYPCTETLENGKVFEHTGLTKRDMLVIAIAGGIAADHQCVLISDYMFAITTADAIIDRLNRKAQ